MFRDRFILASSTIVLICLQVALWSLILKGGQLPSVVPLWRIQPDVSQLAPVEYLWIIPGIAAGCWLVNLGLGWKLYRRYPAITHLLAATSAAISILALAAIVRIITIFTTLP